MHTYAHVHVHVYVPLTMSTLDVQCVHRHSTSVFELSLPHFFFSAYLHSVGTRLMSLCICTCMLV